ncbi:MAG: RnfABCDGE type electron transport complex subunit C [Bacilli bacterium]|nr:RnfABCDGE type electron transport complex subunit C [Bacilli bacterium]
MVSIEDKKISPSKKIIDDVKIQIIYIPLKSKLGYVYKPTVKVGDYVCIDDTLGINVTTDFALKSSVSGTIVGIEKKYISNGHLVDCLVIENDFKEKYRNKLGKKKDITKYSKECFLYMLQNSGITGMGGGDYPTFIKYSTNNKINYLIVNGIESEIYSSSDNALMYNYAEEILECIDAITEIMDIDKAYIAINENNSVIIKKFLKHINTYPNIKIYPIIDAYPSGWERYLVNEITNLNYENNPSEVGVIVNNVSTIYSIYELLKYNRPSTEKIVTIAGAGVRKPANYKVKIGTNFSELMLKTDGYSKINNPVLVAGGAMMGKSIPTDELIITRDLNTILVLEETNQKSEKCIKCGKCSEVCPVGLMPVMIIDSNDRTKKLRIDKCIGCGLCSYVCPSKIEVREILESMKEK